MEYTDKQIEEAVKSLYPQQIGEWDEAYQGRISGYVEILSLGMRMVREEMRLSLLDHVVKEHSTAVLGDFPDLPEFWKEPKPPVTESQWQPIETLPADNTVVLLAHNMCPPFTGWRDRETGNIQASAGIESWVASHWMPIPELPK